MTPRGGGVEISFVFFIDIIMAVTGVMLFVIILLVLDLDLSKNETQPKLEPAKAPAVATIEPPTRVELPPPKPDENATAHEIAVLRDRIRESEAEMRKLETSIAEAEKKTASAREETGDLSKLSGRNLKHVNMSLADAKVADRKVVLIEFSKDTILVQPLEGTVRPVVCKGEAMGNRVDSAMDALKSYPKDRFAVVLIVKPSAFNDANLFMETLRGKDYAVGAEPLEEDRTAIKW